MVYGDSKLLRKQAMHTEPEANPFTREVDKNDPLYCKACEKLFAKDTVFRAHLLGKKHIQGLKAKGKLREAMALESKASMKNKLELKQKRDRDGDETAIAAREGARKKQKELEEEVGPRFVPNYTSMASCISSLRGKEEENKRIAEATKRSLRIAAEEQEAKERRNIKDDGLGPKAMPVDPMKNVVNKDWWKGTAHAQGPSAEETDDASRGNWICLSHKCSAHENPRAFTTCGKCGAQRRIGQDGKQPNIKNTSNSYARRDEMRNPCKH